LISEDKILLQPTYVTDEDRGIAGSSRYLEDECLNSGNRFLELNALQSKTSNSEYENTEENVILDKKKSKKISISSSVSVKQSRVAKFMDSLKEESNVQLLADSEKLVFKSDFLKDKKESIVEDSMEG